MDQISCILSTEQTDVVIRSLYDFEMGVIKSLIATEDGCILKCVDWNATAPSAVWKGNDSQQQYDCSLEAHEMLHTI